jgi:FkbM family methyltransferase
MKQKGIIKNLIYSILEKTIYPTGKKVNISGFSLSLPIRYSRFFSKNYETDNMEFLRNNVSEGMTMIDIGAHIGLYTIAMGKIVKGNGTIYSFEPTPATFKVLQKNIHINKMNNIVRPINKAVSDREGTTTFYINDTDVCNSNSLASNYNNKKGNGINVALTSIDKLVETENISFIDIIKIDAEGAEYSVLKGSEKTLRQFRPKIILGLHPKAIENFGDSLIVIYDFISTLGYKITYENKIMSKEVFIKKRDIFDVRLI